MKNTESETALHNIGNFLSVAPKKITHNFLGFGIHKSSCVVEIYESNGKCFVLFVDTGNGTSVTNAAEQLITEIYEKHLIGKYSPNDILFAETYEADRNYPGFLDNGHVDAIIPTWNGSQVEKVEWKHIGKLVEPR